MVTLEYVLALLTTDYHITFVLDNTFSTYYAHSEYDVQNALEYSDLHRR
jgi:hypothetical protein